MSIGGTMPDRIGSASVLSTNRNFAATRPASASSAPARPASAASSTNGSCVYQREAPTSRMMPVSTRLLNAATWIVLEISSNAASACNSASAIAAFRTPLNSEKIRSSTCGLALDLVDAVLAVRELLGQDRVPLRVLHPDQVRRRQVVLGRLRDQLRVALEQLLEPRVRGLLVQVLVAGDLRRGVQLAGDRLPLRRRGVVAAGRWRPRACRSRAPSCRRSGWRPAARRRRRRARSRWSSPSRWSSSGCAAGRPRPRRRRSSAACQRPTP